MEVTAHAPTQLNVKLVAYLITPDQLLNLNQWDPNTHVVSEHILGGVLEHTVMCDSLQETSADGQHLFKGSCNMVFRGEACSAFSTQCKRVCEHLKNDGTFAQLAETTIL